jgi:hypothetical protein
MATSILKVLTELTALSSNGITVLKPFRPWYGIESWRGRKIGMRLINAGEMESAMDFINTSSTAAQEQAFKKEVVARSLWTIDGSYVASKEDIEDYNDLHKSELSELEYKRVHVSAFEQYFMEYLYSLYLELQQKQARKVFGFYQCAICKNTVKEIPVDARRLKFNTAEILCSMCLPNIVDDDLFEFEIVTEISPTTSPAINAVPTIPADALQQNSVRPQAEFETLADYKDYLVELAEKNEGSPDKIRP